MCADGGDTFNTSKSSYRQIYRQWDRMPCRADWYIHLTTGGAYRSGQWHAGSHWSGYHWFTPY